MEGRFLWGGINVLYLSVYFAIFFWAARGKWAIVDFNILVSVHLTKMAIFFFIPTFWNLDTSDKGEMISSTEDILLEADLGVMFASGLLINWKNFVVFCHQILPFFWASDGWMIVKPWWDLLFWLRKPLIIFKTSLVATSVFWTPATRWCSFENFDLSSADLQNDMWLSAESLKRSKASLWIFPLRWDRSDKHSTIWLQTESQNPLSSQTDSSILPWWSWQTV